MQGEIEASAYEWTTAVEAGRRTIVGMNAFAEDEGERIELHRLDPEAERRQLERTRASARRAQRGRGGARRSRRCATAARGTENMLPPMREALAAQCTVGEICGVLRDEWGTYDRSMSLSASRVKSLRKRCVFGSS